MKKNVDYNVKKTNVLDGEVGHDDGSKEHEYSWEHSQTFQFQHILLLISEIVSTAALTVVVLVDSIHFKFFKIWLSITLCRNAEMVLWVMGAIIMGVVLSLSPPPHRKNVCVKKFFCDALKAFKVWVVRIVNAQHHAADISVPLICTLKFWDFGFGFETLNTKPKSFFEREIKENRVLHIFKDKRIYCYF